MADSKYADLPGIAYNQVDVYETTDLPESEQFTAYSEDESEAVEKLHINATEAFGKFKGKHVVTTGVDFSDRISKRNRTGFGVWELSGNDESETPMQKYQRLQCEINELHDELNQIKEKAQQDEESRNAADILSHLEEAGKQLNNLKLYDCLGTDLVTNLMDPQGTRLKQLETQIEQFKSASVPQTEKPGAPSEAGGTKGFLKYEMMYLPEKARMQEVARVSNLEQRLAKLEGVIGASDDKLAKFTQNLKSQGIVESVQKLAAKSSLLDSSQVEAMETRISSLLHRMDVVAQKKSALSPDADRDHISEMYEIVKKTEAISQIIPQTLERMIALNAVHRRAGEFSQSLAQLEELQTQISNSLESNKSVLKGVQESFATNLQVIKKDIEVLEGRVKKLKK